MQGKACRKRVKKVIAVEKDAAMCRIVKDVLNVLGIVNVEIVCGDILKVNGQWSNVKCRDYKVVANIPYYITQPIIRLFLEAEYPPKEIVLLVQKEVAQRICATPPKMSLLAVSVQFYAQPEIISYVSKNNFWPRPKVDSAILKISRISTCPPLPAASGAGRRANLPQISQIDFFKVVRAGFSSPRKMLINNLSKKLEIPREKLVRVFDKVRLDYKVRAENLSIEDWTNLSTALFRLYKENMV